MPGAVDGGRIGRVAAMQFVGDAVVGHKTLPASLMLTALAAVGLVLAGLGLW